MNGWDLFEALGEIEPTLPEKPKKHHRGGLRIALIAAVITVLVGTAVAVGLGVRVRHDEKTVELQGVSLERNDGSSTKTLSYYTAQVEFELRTVSAEPMQELSQALTEAWVADNTTKSAELRLHNGKRRDLGTVEEAEAFLGLELLNCDELEDMVRGIYVTMLICDSERAQKEYETSGSITPDGLILYLSLRRGADSAFDATVVSESGITVFVALTEEFLKSESEQCLYSYEKEGAFRESGLLTKGGRSLLLMENTPEEGFGQNAYAAWCSRGLGYLAHIKTYPESYATPLSLLTPILYGMK